MSQNFKTIFMLRNATDLRPGALPLYVRITIDGKRTEWSIQRKCEPDKWNQVAQKMIGTKQEAVQLNQYLDVLRTNIFEIHKEYILKNIPLTPEIVKQKLLHKERENQHSLLEVYQYHNDQFKELVGIEFSIGTYKKFKSAILSMKNFIEWKFKRSDIFLSEITHQFITDYEFYLKTVQGNQHNSSLNNIKKLKKIIRLCIANKWIASDPFFNYKMRLKQTHRNFLHKDELELLVLKKFSIDRLDKVKDLFLFSCYTGLAYADIMNLTKNDISLGIDDELWIFKRRTKTDTDSRIPLLPIAKGIIEKYKSTSEAEIKNKLLPQLSNSRLNGYLKEIADHCGFNKELTFHCARHTFATTVTLSNGVPIETVGKMLGHNNLRTTQQYARILDRKVSDDMKVLREILTTKEPTKIINKIK